METNIQKMQVLLETVRAGSFTRAAERLSYSQSGVSRMVGDLETDWGFKVLDRSREGVVLSADGRQIMPAVEALCEELAACSDTWTRCVGSCAARSVSVRFRVWRPMYCRR